MNEIKLIVVCCALALGILIITLASILEDKINALAKMIFKDKTTFTPKPPVKVRHSGRKHFKGECPICGNGVNSRWHSKCPICQQRLNWHSYKRLNRYLKTKEKPHNGIDWK